MRWMIVTGLAGCAAAARPPDVEPRVHVVTCAGVRVPVPPSLRVVQVRNGALIAASRDVALAVFEDGPPRTGSTARVIEELTDLERPVYRLAFRDADRCTFRAVVRMPASAEALAVVGAVAGTAEPSLIVGGPRVPAEPALTVLLRDVEDHL